MKFILRFLFRLYKLVIGLENSFAPYFEKRLDKLSKTAALDTLVFLKLVKMVFSKTVARLRGSLFVMLS